MYEKFPKTTLKIQNLERLEVQTNLFKKNQKAIKMRNKTENVIKLGGCIRNVKTKSLMSFQTRKEGDIRERTF